MNDQLALLKAIIMNPKEDSLRLIYADWLQEHGEEDRAEFIRIQVQLANTNPAVLEMVAGCPNHTWEAKEYYITKELRRRERELLEKKRSQWVPELHDACWMVNSLKVVGHGSVIVCDFNRGFISYIQCSAEDFLRHADQLVWNEKMVDKCSKNYGKGHHSSEGHWSQGPHWHCEECGGKEVASRPCPKTAQPIEKVKFTTHVPTMELYSLCREVGMGESPGNVIAHHIEILEANWPGIEFALPPQPEASVLYDDPFPVTEGHTWGGGM